MINHLPITQEPDWLIDVTPKSVLPIQEILTDSLYYPASRFDRSPIDLLSHHIHSFIYVDYSIAKDDLEDNIIQSGFLGYQNILSIDVTENDLSPNGWKPIPLSDKDGDPNKYNCWIQKPFAKWMVFERNNDADDSHGAKRFSLLYLCAEGIAAFQALYISNKCAPLAVAIIQPGTGFGANWTDFRDPERIFGRTVLNNPYGVATYLLFDRNPSWPQYSTNICFLGDEDKGIWKYSLLCKKHSLD